MTIRSTFVLVRLAILFFLSGSPFAIFLAGRFPSHIVPIVLAGALVISAPVGIVLTRALQKGLEGEFTANYLHWERSFFLAAAASQVGVLLAHVGRGAVGTMGIVVATGGMMAATWLLLKTAPASSRRAGRFLASADQDRFE
jgi:hypothetical protein